MSETQVDRLAHLSRRLTIRTTSQTQNAAKVIPKIGRAMAMLAILSGVTRVREGWNVTGIHSDTERR